MRTEEEGVVQSVKLTFNGQTCSLLTFTSTVVVKLGISLRTYKIMSHIRRKTFGYMKMHCMHCSVP